MSGKVWVVGLLAISLGAVLATVWVFTVGAKRPAAEDDRPLDPLVQALLKEPFKADWPQDPAFVTTLSTLLGREGKTLRDVVPETSFLEGRAVRVRTHVVAVLRGQSGFIPGDDTWHLLLLDRDGRLLDAVSCSVNNRLTRFWGQGDFRTDPPQTVEWDRADLTVRFVPEAGERVAGNWSHEICHQGKKWTFVWDQDRPQAIRSAQWERDGLCRVAVTEGKFAVLFPHLEEPTDGR